MKALILAAGLGSRLGTMTTNRPKALTPVAGRTILERQLDVLLAYGVREVGVVLGHQGDLIPPCVRQCAPRLDVAYFWNREFRETNSAYSFWQARAWVGEGPYLHLNCDIIFSEQQLRVVLESPSENVVSVRTDVVLGPKMENVALDANGRITRMALTPFPGAVGKAFGLARFGLDHLASAHQSITAALRAGDRNQNYFGVIRQAVDQVAYYACPATPQDLLEINTLDDLARAETVLAS